MRCDENAMKGTHNGREAREVPGKISSAAGAGSSDDEQMQIRDRSARSLVELVSQPCSFTASDSGVEISLLLLSQSPLFERKVGISLLQALQQFQDIHHAA